MSRDETALELEKLRADVAALSDARREAAEAPEPPAATEPRGAEPPRNESAGAEIDEREQSQLEELGALLEQEIRDLPTITTLAVFTLGILMGRLMR